MITRFGRWIWPGGRTSHTRVTQFLGTPCHSIYNDRLGAHLGKTHTCQQEREEFVFVPVIFLTFGWMAKIGTYTWRLIPVSKWLVTTIDKPFGPFGRGTNLGDLLTMVIRFINHLLNGIRLQVYTTISPQHAKGLVCVGDFVNTIYDGVQLHHNVFFFVLFLNQQGHPKSSKVILEIP